MDEQVLLDLCFDILPCVIGSMINKALYDKMKDLAKVTRELFYNEAVQLRQIHSPKKWSSLRTNINHGFIANRKALINGNVITGEGYTMVIFMNSEIEYYVFSKQYTIINDQEYDVTYHFASLHDLKPCIQKVILYDSQTEETSAKNKSIIRNYDPLIYDNILRRMSKNIICTRDVTKNYTDVCIREYLLCCLNYRLIGKDISAFFNIYTMSQEYNEIKFQDSLRETIDIINTELDRNLL